MDRRAPLPSVVRITVRAKPRAKISRITSASGLSVSVSLAVPPVDGKANEELVSVLSAALGVPRRALDLKLGRTGRNKVVEVEGLAEAEVVERLAESAQG